MTRHSPQPRDDIDRLVRATRDEVEALVDPRAEFESFRHATPWDPAQHPATRPKSSRTRHRRIWAAGAAAAATVVGVVVWPRTDDAGTIRSSNGDTSAATTTAPTQVTPEGTSTDETGSFTSPPAPTPPPDPTTSIGDAPTAPPPDVRLPDDISVLADIARDGRFAVNASGGILLFGAVPAELTGQEANLLFPEAQSGYLIDLGGLDGVPPTTPTGRQIVVQLSVSLVDDATRQFQQEFLAEQGYTTVSLGRVEAWIGSDATSACPPPPEDGYSETVLYWFDHDIAAGLSVQPVPECEADDGALPLQTIIDMARAMVACTGFESGQLRCEPAFGSTTPTATTTATD